MKGCGRDRHGRKDEQGKGVVQAAREKDEERQLRDVEQKCARNFVFTETLVFRVDEDGDEIGNNRGTDGEEAKPEVEVEIVKALGDRDRGQLSENRHPAQDDERAQAHPVGAAELGVERIVIGIHRRSHRVRQAVLL